MPLSNPQGEIGAGIPAVGRRSAQKFWESYFNFYDTLNQSEPYCQMLERQTELLEPLQGRQTLDAGAGTGNLAVLLLARGARVTGIDFCEPALDKCRQKAVDADFRFGDLTEPLDFEPSSFDRVACCCVLHVLGRRPQQFAIAEFYRILKPGGVVAITAFAEGFSPIAVYVETLRQRRQTSGWTAVLWFGVRHLFNTARILYYVFRIQRRERSGDYCFVTRESLGRMLSEAGFQNVQFERIFASQCLTATAVKPV